MAKHNRKKYRFTDEILTGDTAIAIFCGSISLIGIVFSLIYSMIRGGNVPAWIGSVLLGTGVTAVCGLVFAVIGYRNPDGGTRLKRTSVILSLLALALLVWIGSLGR